MAHNIEKEKELIFELGLSISPTEQAIRERLSYLNGLARGGQAFAKKSPFESPYESRNLFPGRVYSSSERGLEGTQFRDCTLLLLFG